jgi:hypothetical protein
VINAIPRARGIASAAVPPSTRASAQTLLLTRALAPRSDDLSMTVLHRAPNLNLAFAQDASQPYRHPRRGAGGKTIRGPAARNARDHIFRHNPDTDDVTGYLRLRDMRRDEIVAHEPQHMLPGASSMGYAPRAAVLPDFEPEDCHGRSGLVHQAHPTNCSHRPAQITVMRHRSLRAGPLFRFSAECSPSDMHIIAHFS